MCMKDRFKQLSGYLYSVLASFIISAGWGWYHLSKRDPVKLWLTIAAFTVGIFIGFHIGKIVYRYAVKKLGRHPFWGDDFVRFLDPLFFYTSLFFGIFFLKNELASVAYSSVIILLVFWRLQHYLSHHPAAHPWLTVNRTIFVFGFFLFIVQAVVQYSAFRYYILDSNLRFFNIVLFRSVAMTLFWLTSFSVASFVYWKMRGFMRYGALFIFALAFTFFIALWTVNVGALYYSGLYLSPSAVQHAGGAGVPFLNSIMRYLMAGGALVFVVFIFMARMILRAQRKAPERYWHFYNSIIVMAAVLGFAGISSFRNTPESVMVRSFYNHYRGEVNAITLDLAVQKKLEKFGLMYNTNTFYVNERSLVFGSSTVPLLPDRFNKTKPNVIIVFLESFSARLSDVYSSKYPGVTPALKRMAENPGTTVFKHFYNASTPTITGTISHLCSFLPPTGHNEINNEGKLQGHRLLCLPEVLKSKAGYKEATFITAVEKEYSHKNGIFTNAGVDQVLGMEELRSIVPGEPLSWGYSDHQLYPAMWQMVQSMPQPFVTMLATVDTHPPFNIAKDALKYRDGGSDVLNAFHTSDDAFGKFWDEFVKSPLYNNTIVIAVADHAVFPAALTKELFPEDAKTLTYYDPNLFIMYVPDSVLPKEVDMYSSSLDFTPTLLHILGINVPNSFEGRSIFDDRAKYPNILGMHELGLYINQEDVKNTKTTKVRKIDYSVPSEIQCAVGYSPSSTPELTLCDYLEFYRWKRAMFEEGRFWKK